MTDKNRNFSLEEEYFVKLGIFLIADIFIFFNVNSITGFGGLYRTV